MQFDKAGESPRNIGQKVASVISEQRVGIESIFSNLEAKLQVTFEALRHSRQRTRRSRRNLALLRS